MKNSIVLDLETKKSFAQVGGAGNKHLLGVSLVGIYHYANDSFSTYRDDNLEALEPILRAADLVIGFNTIHFDYPVLASVLGDWVLELPSYDIMQKVQSALGHRLSLDALAHATLGTSKTGSGLDALHYYAQGDWQSLERYCLQDVKLTRDLYNYMQKEHMLYYYKGQQGQRRVPIPVGEHPLSALFQAAARAKHSIKLRYKGAERLLDVHSFDGVYIVGYDHTRRASRRFRIDNIEKAERVRSSQALF